MENNYKKPENRIPRVLALHDLSCFGRCALTVVIPTLSSMGIQTVPVPTALLSTHTGGFSDMYFEDMTEKICAIGEHFDALSIDFDAIYTGFLGSEEQIGVVARLIDRFGSDCPVFVDPVMGDDGELYSTYTAGMVEGMKALCRKADIITPNLTEACMLADMPYPADRDMKISEVRELLHKLCRKISEMTSADIVITGIHFEGGRVGTYVARDDKLFDALHIGRNYPGTGDLFASVMLGELMCGCSLFDAAARASEFTRDAIAYSENFPTDVREGVAFEPLLHKLCPRG